MTVLYSSSPGFSLPSAARRKVLGSGQGTFGSFSCMRATARGDRMMTPCAASPPSTFCHEKVTTSSFVKSIGIANTPEVASQMVMPSRSSAIQSRFGTFTPEVVPFSVKMMSCVRSAFARSGSFP